VTAGTANLFSRNSVTDKFLAILKLWSYTMECRPKFMNWTSRNQSLHWLSYIIVL
jgi:hypothetical protein